MFRIQPHVALFEEICRYQLIEAKYTKHAPVHALRNDLHQENIIFLFQERRIKAIKEQIRILKLDGRALIFVWAMEQIKDRKKSRAYLKSEESESTGCATKTVETESGKLDLILHKNRQKFEGQDLLVPWELNKGWAEVKKDDNLKGNERFLRYYHVFKEGELEKICEEIENCEVERSFYEEGNWCVILRKIK